MVHRFLIDDGSVHDPDAPYIIHRAAHVSLLVLKDTLSKEAKPTKVI